MDLEYSHFSDLAGDKAFPFFAVAEPFLVTDLRNEVSAFIFILLVDSAANLSILMLIRKTKPPACNNHAEVAPKY
jgi:hypothetical protein